MPAKKVAYSMSGNKIGFRGFVGLSAGIQAGTCYRRGSDDGNKTLEKLLSSYLKVTKNAKKNNQSSSAFFSIIDFRNNVHFLPVTATVA
jgi:hypothetical protein